MPTSNYGSHVVRVWCNYDMFFYFWTLPSWLKSVRKLRRSLCLCAGSQSGLWAEVIARDTSLSVGVCRLNHRLLGCPPYPPFPHLHLPHLLSHTHTSFPRGHAQVCYENQRCHWIRKHSVLPLLVGGRYRRREVLWVLKDDIQVSMDTGLDSWL